MLRIYILLFLFVCLRAQKTTIITDYSVYVDKWKEIASTKQIVNVTSMANQDEKCYDRACEFYYYMQVNQQLMRLSSRNTTILIVAGLKGNDYLAVNSMLNIYGKINAARVIYLPVANPSGFIKNKSKTYPNEVEIFSDFPTTKNTKECFKSSASRILDHLYREYEVGVTILIEEGELSLRYRSAKSLNGKSTPLQHEEIFDYLFGSITKKSIQLEQKYKQEREAQTFTINDTSNGLIDWVYGVPMFPQYFNTTCITKGQDRQKLKKKGIAFGLSIGKLSEKNLNFIEQRTPILLKQISLIANPQIMFNLLEQNMMEVKLKGCSTANLTNISILLNGLDHQLLSESVQFDNLNYESKFIELSNFQFLKIESKEKKIKFKYTCHGRWLPKDNNLFIKVKQYQQQYDLHIKSKVQQQQKEITQQSTQQRPQQNVDKPRGTELKQTKSSRVELVQSQKEQEYIDKLSKNVQPTTAEQIPVSLLKDLLKTILVGGLVIVTVCYIINCLKVGTAVFLSRTRRYEQKFEEVEYTQNLQQQNPPEPNQENSQLVSR